MLMAAANPSRATTDFAALRRTMVECQIRTFDVTDQVLLARFLEVPRELFVPPQLAALAYSDATLKVGLSDGEERQRSLLPPLVLARLMQAAEIGPSDKILDVAAGTGYSTALLAGLGHEVIALETDPALAATITANLAKLGSLPARTVTGPLAAGAPAEGPFDLIFVNGAVESHLEQLFAQLKDGGRMIAIKVDSSAGGTAKPSHAMRFDKTNGAVGWRQLFDVGAPVLKSFATGVHFVF